MQVIMLNAADFYYLPRIKNLEKEFLKCSSKFTQLDKEYREYLELNNPSIAQLNILASQIETVVELMAAISSQIKRLQLEFCN